LAHRERRELPLPEGAAYLTLVESASEHLDPIEHDNGYTIPEFGFEAGLIDVDALKGPTLAAGPALHNRVRLFANPTHGPSDEANGTGHRILRQVGAGSPSGIVVPLMRPATVLAIVLLLLVLGVAGIVFVIQLQSVT
jgi:hypothetical protein